MPRYFRCALTSGLGTSHDRERKHQCSNRGNPRAEHAQPDLDPGPIYALSKGKDTESGVSDANARAEDGSGTASDGRSKFTVVRRGGGSGEYTRYAADGADREARQRQETGHERARDEREAKKRRVNLRPLRIDAQ